LRAGPVGPFSFPPAAASFAVLPWLFGLLVAISGLVVLLLLSITFVPASAYLQLDSEGFTLRILQMKIRHRWAEVEGIRYGNTSSVVVEFTPEYAERVSKELANGGLLKRFFYSMAGDSSTLYTGCQVFDLYGLSRPLLASLLKSYRLQFWREIEQRPARYFHSHNAACHCPVITPPAGKASHPERRETVFVSPRKGDFHFPPGISGRAPYRYSSAVFIQI